MHVRVTKSFLGRTGTVVRRYEVGEVSSGRMAEVALADGLGEACNAAGKPTKAKAKAEADAKAKAEADAKADAGAE